MVKKHFLEGKVIGMLTVLSRAENKGRRQYYNCICECGNVTVKMAESLLSGRTKSCGCLYVKNRGLYNLKHNGASLNEYRIWSGMKSRCNENASEGVWLIYGGRGIKVCDRWLNSFENFFEDMGKRPSKKHSIDRVDNNKGYSPENCRWATPKEQARNTRRCVWIEWGGTKKILKDWAEFLNVDYGSFRKRVKKAGVENSFNYYINKQ